MKKWSQNKMDNPVYVDEENSPLVHQDEDVYERYDTPNTCTVDEGSFTLPEDATETTATLRLRQKVKRDKITALYRHLNVTDNLDLIDLDRFRLTKDSKKGSQSLSFTTRIGGSF